MPRGRPLTVHSVAVGSQAEAGGIRAGDRLVEVDGRKVRDAIDWQFYSAEEAFDCVFQRVRERISVRFDTTKGTEVGLDFEPMQFMCCGNHCVFCFVDQNPEGMREAIYLKDEDYRLSFLYGNYVTLTSANRADLERIVEQRLSPLYVSIHATDAAVRKELLGLKLDDYLLEKLRFLFDYGIEVHGQLVICPGINDGHVLDETIETLQTFYPDLRSLSIVPVGLTQHRQGLRDLKPIDTDIAACIIQQVAGLQEAWTNKHGDAFVYLADEFYLLTRNDVPPLSHYGDFWQLDNGVGMMRYFLSEFEASAENFPDGLDRPQRVTMATGMLAASVLQEYVAPRLNAIDGLCVDIQAVPNRFYGDSVTVSGLLTGRDIIEAFEHDMDDSIILLPPNCVNSDGLMLDETTPDGLARTLGRSVRILDELEELWDEQ